ncbi:Orf y [Tanacetum coccineum]
MKTKKKFSVLKKKKSLSLTIHLHHLMMNHQNKVISSQFSWEGENRRHFVCNLQKHEDSVRNITNPNSIYIQGNLKFKGFKEYKLHCYIDTGSSLCLASKYVFPHDLWENSPREITATIANGDTIKINQVCRNISLKLSGYEFNIPTIYQQDSGIDLILGNNFCQLFGPFVQWIDRIAFHLNDELIIIKKVTKAFSQGQPNFLESMKKDSKIKQIPGTNISQENIKGCNIFLQINKYKIIEEILDKVCSENPIDPQKTKDDEDTIETNDPNTVLSVKPMCLFST